MAGISDIYVPTTGEILLAEYTLYGNYGLPTQFLLGFINESFKLTITREFHNIKVYGAFCNVLDPDGIPLFRYDRLVPMLTIESLALRYINNDIITGAEPTDNFESGNWAGGDGTYSDETTLYQTGTQSAKLTGDADGEGIHEVFATAKDFENFSNGIAGSTADKICWGIYITTAELAKLDTGLKLKIHCDAEGTETNYYYYDIAKASLTADAWTNFTIARSDFTSAGGGAEDWGAVTGISLTFDGAPSAEASAYIDSVSLLQDSTDSSIVGGNIGGKYAYTDEGDYKQFTPKLTIADSEYLDNIGLVGQFHDGKRLDIILENCIDDGSINIAIQEKTEVVYSAQFTGHYKRETPHVVPIEFRHYKTAS
jgi:hypothetical protein